jgi:integrase
VRAAYTERSTGQPVLGQPKSRAGRRIVGVPDMILPVLTDHLATYSRPEPDALIFPGPFASRGNFNRQAGWPRAVAAIGASGLRFHDLRHTGNSWDATSGAGLRDLMARMGHDSERAASNYQHEACGADAAITRAIDAHAQAERRSRPDDPVS